MEKPNFIEVYNNVYSDTFCKKIIEYFENALDSGFALDRQLTENVSKLHKEDISYYIPNYNMDHIDRNIAKEFNNILWSEVYPKYVGKYNILSFCDPHSTYAIKIQKTEPSQGYHIWHSENMSRDTSHRLLAWTVYLNDNFEAGETEFLYQQYRYKPKMGDVVIFPAAFTHTHRGNPPIGGTKYIITGWIEY